MTWENIIKRRKPVPKKNIRRLIDKYVEEADGKVSVRDVNQHLMKKLGIMYTDTTKVNHLRNYLYGWHSEKTDSFDPNVMEVSDYYYDLGE
tara:strand:- start:18318 stop:18590 length:273 start_codon:yes stop_codon:yes gene_type:complete